MFSQLMLGKRSMSIAAIVLVLLFAVANICFADNTTLRAATMKVKPVLKSPPLQSFPSGVEERLAEALKLSPCKSSGEKKIAAAFVVDTDGQVHQMSNCEQYETTPGKPIPAKEVKALNGISLFSTTNPHFCWVTAWGGFYCVVY